MKEFVYIKWHGFAGIVNITNMSIDPVSVSLVVDTNLTIENTTSEPLAVAENFILL